MSHGQNSEPQVGPGVCPPHCKLQCLTYGQTTKRNWSLLNYDSESFHRVSAAFTMLNSRLFNRFLTPHTVTTKPLFTIITVCHKSSRVNDVITVWHNTSRVNEADRNFLTFESQMCQLLPAVYKMILLISFFYLDQVSSRETGGWWPPALLH